MNLLISIYYSLLNVYAFSIKVGLILIQANGLKATLTSASQPLVIRLRCGYQFTIHIQWLTKDTTAFTHQVR